MRIVLQTLRAIDDFLVGLERLDTGAVHVFNGLLLVSVRFFGYHAVLSNDLLLLDLLLLDLIALIRLVGLGELHLHHRLRLGLLLIVVHAINHGFARIDN